MQATSQLCKRRSCLPSGKSLCQSCFKVPPPKHQKHIISWQVDLNIQHIVTGECNSMVHPATGLLGDGVQVVVITNTPAL